MHMDIEMAMDSLVVAAVETGLVTDFLVVAPEEAAETASGTTGLVGVVEAAARGVVHLAGAEVVPMESVTQAELVEVGHGAALSAAQVAAFTLEEASTEDLEVALVAPL